MKLMKNYLDSFGPFLSYLFDYHFSLAYSKENLEGIEGKSLFTYDYDVSCFFPWVNTY